jgi:hypothetical protein
VLALLRNRENFLNDMQTDPDGSGIKFDSILNNVGQFHSTENFYSDIMHDLYEGIGFYAMYQVITYFLGKGDFNIEELNRRTILFDFGFIEKGNLPEPINESYFLKNKKLKMTASELKTFIHFFSMIIGEKIKDKNDSIWQYFIKMQIMFEMINNSEHSEDSLNEMRDVIAQHNEMYVRLFEVNLTPKFHNLIHYPTFIRKLGNLRSLWCFPYERKNRDLKAYTNVNYQRKNLSWSICYKSSLKFSNNLLNNEFCFPKLIDTVVDKKCDLATLKACNFYFLLESNFKENLDAIKICTEVFYKNTLFKKNFYVNCGTLITPLIYRIAEIFSLDSNCFMICEEHINFKFLKDYNCYLSGTESSDFKIIKFSEVVGLPFNIHKTTNGQHMFKIKNI